MTTIDISGNAIFASNRPGGVYPGVGGSMDLVDGILWSDVIGFHTSNSARFRGKPYETVSFFACVPWIVRDTPSVMRGDGHIRSVYVHAYFIGSGAITGVFLWDGYTRYILFSGRHAGDRIVPIEFRADIHVLHSVSLEVAVDFGSGGSEVRFAKFQVSH